MTKSKTKYKYNKGDLILTRPDVVLVKIANKVGLITERFSYERKTGDKYAIEYEIIICGVPECRFYILESEIKLKYNK